jgi:hypothetical protein
MADPWRDALGRFISGNPFQFRTGLKQYQQPSIIRHAAKLLANIYDEFEEISDEPITHFRKVWIPGLGIKTEWEGAHTVITIDETDKALIMEDLRRLSHPDEEIEKSLKEIGYFITDEVIPRIFREEERNPMEGSWSELAQRTLSWRRQIGSPYSKGAYPGGMLRPVGDLYETIKSHDMVSVTEENEGFRMTISGQNIRNKFQQQLFYWHQLGTDLMPDRPMIPTSESDLRSDEQNEINKIFEHHMDNLIGQW